MRALLLKDKTLSFTNHAAISPDEGHIPIQVLAAGICETDLQLVQGYMGFQGILGHEFVGIAQAGKHAGQRVVGEINCACHNCPTCKQGFPTHCPHRTVLGILNHDGAFAETVYLPEENLHAVPDSVSDEAAVLVEPLAAAYQIPAQLDLSRYQRLAVLGDGRLGHLIALVLQSLGHSPLVIGKHAHKLAALSSKGLQTALISDFNEAHVFDLIVDCTGSKVGFTDACRLVQPRGTIVLKTTVADPHGPNLASVVIDEITVVGSRCGPFPPAIDALSRQLFDVESLITSRFRLEDFETAFETAKRPDQLKVLFTLS